MQQPVQHYSLVYPIYKFPVDQIFVLLGLQKTGKWAGYLNGFGGQVQPSERYHACARRELKEETGLIVEEGELMHHGRILYKHENEEFPPSSVYLYLYEKWDGKYPSDGELEGNLGNFSYNQIPFHKMPPHDNLWLPRILKGEFIQARLTYETRADDFLLKKVEYNNSRLKPRII